MNKKSRDRLFGSFVFLFIIITFILSLIATGYRFNLSWPINFNHLLQKTGTIALDSNPKGAKITINGEQKKGLMVLSLFNDKNDLVTPVKIKNLLPGEYIISFNMDGYWPYEKKLRVNATQTTYLENVILFKKGLAVNINTGEAQDIDYSPNNHYAWLKKDQTIIDLKKEVVIYHHLLPTINWTDNDKLISESSKIVNLETAATTDYQAAIGTPQEAQLINNKIIYLNNNNLTIYNISDRISKAVASDGEIINYQAGSKNILVVIKKDNKVRLESFSIDNGQKINTVDLLIEAKKFKIKEEDSNTISLIDEDHKLLYLIDANNKLSILDTFRGLGAYKWKGDGQFIYALGSEIYMHDLKQDKSWLINRLSEEVNSLAWSSNNYLIYAGQKNIGIINLSDGRNDVTVILTGDNIASLNLDDKNQILYFYGLFNSQSGLYKIGLR